MKKSVLKVLSITLSVIMLVGMIPFAGAAETMNEVPTTKTALNFPLGDVNHDGKVKANDARLTLRFSASLEDEKNVDPKLADVDGDGFIKVSDARIILRVAAGLQQLDSVIEYIVEFDTNGGPEVPSQKVFAGECAEDPNVFREGYQLIGWYFSKTGAIDLFDFDIPITGNTKIYARWYDENDTVDTDKDGLTDFVERQFGMDPNKIDTDGDGVGDFNELEWINSDPCLDDTNKDGVLDGDDDTDTDGLINKEEEKLGTNPAYFDTDFDYLPDYDEINVYHTDPINPDTDGDGAIDGDEVQNNSDPLVKQTTFITEETLGVIDSYNPVAVSANVTTDAEGIGTLEINPVTYSENPLISNFIPGKLGDAFDFSVDGDFVSATLTFSYDTALGELGEDFQPRIYYVNEITGEFEELENQTVENGVVTATVSHFSTYILLNKIAFDKVWDTDIKKPNEEGKKLTKLLISFVIDSSGSMDWNDSYDLRKELTQGFIEKMSDEDMASIIEFDSYSSVLSDFTSDKNSLNYAVDGIDSYGGTYIFGGLQEALSLFENIDDAGDETLKIIFLLTDGIDDGWYSSWDSYMALANECTKNNIQLYTVGLSHEVNYDLLGALATQGSGKYYFAEKDLDLISGFDILRQETIDYITDSNNDGISDYYTELINSGTLLPSNGTYMFAGVIDKYGADCADWDGDGLLNGEEIEIAIGAFGQTYIRMHSNPTQIDSDGDKYTDYDEVKKNKTSPLKYTKANASSIEALMNDENYDYVGYTEDHKVAGEIAEWTLLWTKKDKSKENYINYFYDYASTETINNAKEARETQKKREKAWEIVEFVTGIAKLGKDVLDLGTDANSYDSRVKATVINFNKAHEEMLKWFNQKEYDKVIKSVGKIDEKNDTFDLDAVNDLLDFAKDSIELRSELTTDESADDWVDGANKIKDGLSSSVSVLSSLYSVLKEAYPKLKEYRLDFGKKINDFSRNYQAWLKKRPSGDISGGAFIGIAFDAVDYIEDVGEINNLYGKIMANHEALDEYFELLDYIYRNADEECIRTAAGDIVKILLDDSDKAFYNQLTSAIAAETAELALKALVSIAGDVCPYVKIAEMVCDAVKATISITGLTESAKLLLYSKNIKAISNGCKYFLNGEYEVEGKYYSFDQEKDERIMLYLIQLAQSRIVGENRIRESCEKFNLGHFVIKLFTGATNDDIEEYYNQHIDGVYANAGKLRLFLSHNLPRYTINKLYLLKYL